MNETSLEYCEKYVKIMIVSTFINRHLNSDDLGAKIDILARIFKHKKKVIKNLALYLKKSVDTKGITVDTGLRELAFFVDVLEQYVNKNIGQPIEK